MGHLIRTIAALMLLHLATASADPVVDAMQEYMEFAEYSEGAILPEQVAQVGLASFYIIDTRNAQQYAKGHLAGAVNIEWRKILENHEDLPTDKPILLYCDTGMLSARAHFALKVAGHDNVKVLHRGLDAWKDWLNQQPDKTN